MIRVLRYPRLSVLFFAASLGSAMARDACMNAGLEGWAQAFLAATIVALGGALTLFSCRFVVGEWGVGVGFLLHVRRTTWEELAALGALCCNSRRMYLYGLYRGEADFLRLLHRAPNCGRWGFVVPLSRRLADEVKLRCPYPVDLSKPVWAKKPGGMRALWRHAAINLLVLVPTAVVSFLTGVSMLLRGVELGGGAALMLALFALAMFVMGGLLLRRVLVSRVVRPAVSEAGVSVGRGLYLPWDEVRFGYVHRVAKVSGFFLLSRMPEELTRMGAPPVICMSMPDMQTVLLAYLTYCPHAPKGMDVD